MGESALVKAAERDALVALERFVKATDASGPASVRMCCDHDKRFWIGIKLLGKMRWCSLTLYSSSTQRGRARGVGSSSSICSAKKKPMRSNSCLVLSPSLLLTDNIRERHLVFENVSDLSTSGKKWGLYSKAFMDYCENREGVALSYCRL